MNRNPTVKKQRFITDIQRKELQDNLRLMGFSNYAEYQRSDLWKRIRLAVLERDGGKCRQCGREANSVHHTQYSQATLRGELLVHLRSACRDCHHRSHASGSAGELRPKQNKLVRCVVCNHRYMSNKFCKHCAKKRK